MKTALACLACLALGAASGYLYGAAPPPTVGELSPPDDPLPIIMEFVRKQAVHPESVVLAKHQQMGTAAVVVCGLRAKGQLQNVVEEQRVFFVGGVPLLG